MTCRLTMKMCDFSASVSTCSPAHNGFIFPGQSVHGTGCLPINSTDPGGRHTCCRHAALSASPLPVRPVYANMPIWSVMCCHERELPLFSMFSRSSLRMSMMRVAMPPTCARCKDTCT
jgi:hypothetical protein